MKYFLISILLIPLSTSGTAAKTPVLIEDMTWTEVHDAIAAGKTTAIYYAGSIEQNGPGVALGKHLFIAHYLAPKIAEELGNALAYPTMPYAPTGDWGVTKPGTIDPSKKTGHMQFSGSVNVSEETFGAVAHDVALSAISAGFKNIVLMGDHGGGQSTLAKVAQAMDKEWAPKGIHVYYIPDLYYKEKDFMKEYLQKRGIPFDAHAGTDDTSEVMYVDKMVNDGSPKWIRPGKLVNSRGNDDTGVNGDQTKATLEMGKIFTDAKISFAVKQIQQLIAAGK
ncbi:MAG: creatininase family protein [Candidatus Sulfotelmatobacter sp.]